jgi:Cys-rich peptide (Clo7bot family)
MKFIINPVEKVTHGNCPWKCSNLFFIIPVGP